MYKYIDANMFALSIDIGVNICYIIITAREKRSSESGREYREGKQERDARAGTDLEVAAQSADATKPPAARSPPEKGGNKHEHQRNGMQGPRAAAASSPHRRGDRRSRGHQGRAQGRDGRR